MHNKPQKSLIKKIKYSFVLLIFGVFWGFFFYNKNNFKNILGDKPNQKKNNFNNFQKSSRTCEI